MSISRALLSVSDKTGIIEVAKFLASKDVEIVSTGGTAKLLIEHDIPVTSIEKVTGNPEAFGGRMKSISFQVGSGILFRRDHEQDQKDLEKLGIKPIDLVICNLYPFEEVSKKTSNRETLVENIDIGGPTMIRAAAKNFAHVTTLVDPNQYTEFMDNFDSLNENQRMKWSLKAFELTAFYDQYIFNTLTKNAKIEEIPFALPNKKELRYGENPHQKAWLIPWKNHTSEISLADAKQIHGKELSYNNLTDMDAGWKCTSELHQSFPKKNIITIIKHANPCGVAVGDDSLSVLKEAWACDDVSAFGSIISFNQEVTVDQANWLSDKFVEIITAPNFSQEALKVLTEKKNIRLMKIANKPKAQEYTTKSINGGLLIQQEDEVNSYEYKTVTKSQFKDGATDLFQFGMVVNKYLKSNSISLIGNKNGCTVIAGAGMGQPNRLDSLKMLAGPRALEKGFNLENLVLISDAFFPFRDSIDVANEMGIKNIVQPGGSIRDQEVIDACDEHNISMCFTNTRHFRH